MNIPSISNAPFKLLALVSGIVSFLLIVSVILLDVYTPLVLSVSITGLAICGGAYIASHKGYKTESMVVMAWYLLTTILIMSVTRIGVNTPIVFFLPIGIVLLGLYTDPKQTLAYGLAASVGMALVGAGDIAGVVAHSAFVPSDFQLYLFFIISLLMITTGIYISAQHRNSVEDDLHHTVSNLKVSEARFIKLLDSLGDSIFVLNMEGKVRHANAHALRKLDYTQESLLNQPAETICPAINMEYIRNALANVPLGTTLTMYSDLLCKNGELFPIEARITQIETERGAKIICANRDITDRKRAERYMLETQKAQSMGLLAGGVANDFNAILRPVLHQSSVALAKVEPYHPARKHMQLAVQATKRAQAINHQLLAYAGQSDLEKEITDINDLMAENIEFFNLGVPNHITLRTALTPDLPRVRLDRAQFQQAMMNLILNASESISVTRGQIEIATAPLTLEQPQKAGTAPLTSGKYVQIKVTDTGSGMDAETVKHIFEPYFSTRPNSTGLGLAAADSIVRNHHGNIRVTSALGEGSCFEILLPVEPEGSLVMPYRV